MDAVSPFLLLVAPFLLLVAVFVLVLVLDRKGLYEKAYGRKATWLFFGVLSLGLMIFGEHALAMVSLIISAYEYREWKRRRSAPPARLLYEE